MMEKLGKIPTNPSSIQEGIKNSLKSGNACYHLVQNILSYRLLSKNIKSEIYRTKIFLSVCLGLKFDLSY